MAKSKTDLRIVRTRKNIMDSFIELSSKKEFKDITVKDITEAAMINRATFYYHFQDIYDLREKVLSEVLLINLDRHLYEGSELSGETITNIFIAITKFQDSLSNRCHWGYEDTIARITREQLEIIFYNLLKKQYPDEAEEELKTTAVFLSWGLYGVSSEWRRNPKQASPEEYIQGAIPYILNGVQK